MTLRAVFLHLIRKNAFKAFAQLFTTAIEIPVTDLEGITAEKRAKTKARVKIIDTQASQIALAYAEFR
ncbi:MAG: hypothetical protein ACI854_001400 [Arenicella sp.]